MNSGTGAPPSMCLACRDPKQGRWRTYPSPERKRVGQRGAEARVYQNPKRQRGAERAGITSRTLFRPSLTLWVLIGPSLMFRAPIDAIDTLNTYHPACVSTTETAVPHQQDAGAARLWAHSTVRCSSRPLDRVMTGATRLLPRTLLGAGTRFTDSGSLLPVVGRRCPGGPPRHGGRSKRRSGHRRCGWGVARCRSRPTPGGVEDSPC